jgi:hypothetical protein
MRYCYAIIAVHAIYSKNYLQSIVIAHQNIYTWTIVTESLETTC